MPLITRAGRPTPAIPTGIRSTGPFHANAQLWDKGSGRAARSRSRDDHANPDSGGKEMTMQARSGGWDPT